MTKKLISFICPSRNPNIIKSFLDNIEETVKNPELVECLFKVDEDQPGIKTLMDAEVAKRPFSVKYILTPRFTGIYSVWIACNELFTMVSKDAYFVQVISDEVRFKTPHWDEILTKYIGYFSDDIFRLRMSTFMLNSYPSVYMCNLTPDSFPIYTRKWLEVTLGIGMCTWASDTYHQFIAYHMSIGEQGYQYFQTPFYDMGISRDIHLLDIKFDGLEFGVGVSAEIQKNRDLWVTQVWNRNVSHYQQEQFSYLAKRLSSYIWAVKNNIKQFTLVQNKTRKMVQVVDGAGEVRREISYRLPRLPFYWMNLRRRLTVAWVKLGWRNQARFMPSFHTLYRRINVVSDKLFKYRPGLLLKCCVRLSPFKAMKNYFNELLELDLQISVAKMGRLQKNTFLFFTSLRLLGDKIFDSVEKKAAGPLPGLGGEGWPLSLVVVPEKDKPKVTESVAQLDIFFGELEKATYQAKVNVVSQKETQLEY